MRPRARVSKKNVRKNLIFGRRIKGGQNMENMEGRTLAEIINGKKRAPMEIVDKDEGECTNSCETQKETVKLNLKSRGQSRQCGIDEEQSSTRQYEQNNFVSPSSNNLLTEPKNMMLYAERNVAEQKDREELKYNRLLRDNNNRFMIEGATGFYRKSAFNFYNPSLYSCRSTDGDESIYQLGLQIDNRYVYIHLLKHKCGQMTYLMKKLRENGGIVYIEKPSIVQKCLEQFWELCLNTMSSRSILIPVHYGWHIVDGRIYFCKKGEMQLWKEILVLAK